MVCSLYSSILIKNQVNIYLWRSIRLIYYDTSIITRESSVKTSYATYLSMLTTYTVDTTGSG